MKNVFVIVIVLLAGCMSASDARSNSRPAPRSESLSACVPGDDPFSCLRTQCAEARASFNEIEKTCRCANGKLFVSGDRGSCISPESKERVWVFEHQRERAMRLSIEIPKGTAINEFLPAIALPFANDGIIAVNIYRNAENLRAVLSQLHDSLQSYLLNFYRPDTNVYDASINAAVWDKTSQIIRRVFIQPTEGNSRWTQFSEQELVNGKVTAYTSKACAEICSITFELKGDTDFRAQRVRLYSGGNIYDDHINLIDRDNEIAYTLFYLGGRLSHYLKREPDGSHTLFANDGQSVTKISGPAERAPLAKQNFDSESVPVAIFEGYSNEDIDRAVLYGPDIDSHYYGWFKREDGRPFELGRRLVRFGEESSPDPAHGIAIAKLASDQFRQPIIPFFPDHLWNGDFEIFLNNFNGKFVGSLSLTNTMSPDHCAKSGVATIIERTRERALWTAAAGNSGRSGKKTNSLNCPQSLSAPNLIVVAATGDGTTTAENSSRGEKFADILEYGCEPGTLTCRDAATSYAAPRLARTAAKLMQEFPNATASQIRRALILTAKVPFSDPWYSRAQNQFQDVLSGGVADGEAARTFLMDRTEGDIVGRVSRAKAHQYPKLEEKEVKNLVREQIARLKKAGEIL